jgi:hypothetical protein
MGSLAGCGVAMPERFSPQPGLPTHLGSLCERCDLCRRVHGPRSTFFMCTALPERYPRQPVLVCDSFRVAPEPPREG